MEPNEDLKALDRSKSIAVTSTLVLAPNAYRVWSSFVNCGTTVVCLRLGEAAVLDTGICLTANGGAATIDRVNMPWLGEVNAIATTAPCLLAVTEVERRH